MRRASTLTTLLSTALSPLSFHYGEWSNVKVAASRCLVGVAIAIAGCTGAVLVMFAMISLRHSLYVGAMGIAFAAPQLFHRFVGRDDPHRFLKWSVMAIVAISALVVQFRLMNYFGDTEFLGTQVKRLHSGIVIAEVCVFCLQLAIQVSLRLPELSQRSDNSGRSTRKKDKKKKKKGR